MNVERALQDIREGHMVLVYDFDERERETDMIIASQFITPEVIRTMRQDAGGLVCTTTPFWIAERMGLPFQSDVDTVASERYPILKYMSPTDIPYDPSRPSFSLTINHRDTYTGITDNDRALTITEYARMVSLADGGEDVMNRMGRCFRTPGHVHLLNSSEQILQNRRGHTELATALMLMAGVIPSATLCEMMGDDGGSEKKADTRRYADKKGLTFLEGREVIDAWKAFRHD